MLWSVKLVKDGSMEYTVDNIKHPSDVIKLARMFYLDDEPVEKFCMVALNTKNKPIGHFVVTTGIVNSSLVHPREVFQRAILCNASSILLVHNHPSGNTKPSDDDVKITERLNNAGQILGIKVLDHIILGDDYYSFKEHGVIL